MRTRSRRLLRLFAFGLVLVAAASVVGLGSASALMRPNAASRGGSGLTNDGYEPGKVRAAVADETTIGLGSPSVLPSGEMFTPAFKQVTVRFNVADVQSERDRILLEQKGQLDAIEVQSGRLARAQAEHQLTAPFDAVLRKYALSKTTIGGGFSTLNAGNHWQWTGTWIPIPTRCGYMGTRGDARGCRFWSTSPKRGRY